MSLERRETRRASLYPGEREASICFLLHNTLIVLELIFSRDKKYILNLVSNYTSDVLWSIDHHCWLVLSCFTCKYFVLEAIKIFM